MANTAKHKVLYRSCKHKMLGGVCAGVGEYFNTDPNIIRIIWGALVLTPPFWGAGAILYLIAWLLLPSRPC